MFDNGENLAEDAAVLIQGPMSLSNLLTENRVNQNQGNGIVLSFLAATNTIVNNQMLFNTFAGAADFTAPAANVWNENNRCQTQAGFVPPGVCNPSEDPPPQ